MIPKLIAVTIIISSECIGPTFELVCTYNFKADLFFTIYTNNAVYNFAISIIISSHLSSYNHCAKFFMEITYLGHYIASFLKSDGLP